MNKSKFQKVLKCPRCGGSDLLTLGFDQMCCRCDWDNSQYLVNEGQMDNLVRASIDEFGLQGACTVENPAGLLETELEIVPILPRGYGETCEEFQKTRTIRDEERNTNIDLVS